MMLNEKIIALIFMTLKVTCVVGQKKYAEMYNLKNPVIGFSEEMEVSGLEQDKSFTGGKEVKYWLKLPSMSVLYLIGIKETGLSLVTIQQKFSNQSFQAVEKQIDFGADIISTVAFKIFNFQLNKIEDIVVTSIASATNEVIFYKIENYKLVHLWTWKRHTKVQTILHFKVMREERLFILDSDEITGYLYKFSIDGSSVHIRELEVINFSEKAEKISVSLTFPEPYLFVVQNKTLVIYGYTLFCPGSWAGEFMKMTLITGLGITDVIPFQSNGKEYLAVSGKSGGIFRIDGSIRIVQELEIVNAVDWLIIHVDPEKEYTLIFYKILDNNIYILYNTGYGWRSHINPSCYKTDKEHNMRIKTDVDLGCIKNKKWSGAVSLELGQLPTVIFSHRKYIGEMFHIIINIKRYINPMLDMSEQNADYYLTTVRSNIKNLVGGINDVNKVESSCNIVNMLAEIENIAASAKEKVLFSCPVQEIINNKRDGSVIEIVENKITKEEKVNKFDYTSRERDQLEKDANSQSINHEYGKMEPISPDLQSKLSPLLGYEKAVSMLGFPKKQEDII